MERTEVHDVLYFFCTLRKHEQYFDVVVINSRMHACRLPYFNLLKDCLHQRGKILKCAQKLFRSKIKRNYKKNKLLKKLKIKIFYFERIEIFSSFWSLCFCSVGLRKGSKIGLIMALFPNFHKLLQILEGYNTSFGFHCEFSCCRNKLKRFDYKLRVVSRVIREL